MHNREWYSCRQRLLFALQDVERFSFDFEMITYEFRTKRKQQTDSNIKLDWFTEQTVTSTVFGWVSHVNTRGAFSTEEGLSNVV